MPSKKTKEEYIQNANKIHNYKYDYSQIIELPKRDFRVNIICLQHGTFEQSFHKHLSGDGCKKCANEKISKEIIEKSKNKFVSHANNIHNNKYDYSKVNYISAIEKIIIICQNHGDFEQIPTSHLNGNGCKKCANEKVKERMSIPWEIYKEDLIKIFNNKYNYSKVIWKGVEIDIIVECPIHGEFEIRPAYHKTGRGCNRCSKIDFIPYNKLDTQKFIEKSIEIWGNKYDYSKTKYVDSKNKVIIICRKHGDFEQMPQQHYIYDCRLCRCSNRYSKISIEWLSFMEIKHSLKIIHAKNEGEFNIPNSRYKADGYCKETNTIYEFHGDFWHGNPNIYLSTNINKKNGKTFGELYKNTLNKEQHIREMGFNLITIWESEWTKLNKCVKMLQRNFRTRK